MEKLELEVEVDGDLGEEVNNLASRFLARLAKPLGVACLRLRIGCVKCGLG